jgi:hypothetical protein
MIYHIHVLQYDAFKRKKRRKKSSEGQPAYNNSDLLTAALYSMPETPTQSLLTSLIHYRSLVLSD